MFKKAINFGANCVKNYRAACEDHELTGRNHWEYFWVPLVAIGVLLAMLNLIIKIVARIIEKFKKSK